MHNENIRKIDDLIGKIEISIMEHSSDKLYPKGYMDKLLRYLKLIREEKGNIPNISATFALNRKNKNNITNIEESLNIERAIVEKIGAQPYYYLISLEDYNGRLILISGRPDGLEIMYDRVKIIEVKSSGILSKIFKNNVKLDDLELQKIVYRQILFRGLREQLIFYQYLFEKTSKYGLINNVKKIELYGYVVLYLKGEEHLEQLDKVRKKIIDNLKKIGPFLSKFGVHIYGLSEINSTPIGKNKFYYFTIIVKVDYNKKVAMDYLKSLLSSLDRIEIVRNL
ncbi:MAG: hypothetical protein ACO2ON_04110 [Candidatus Nanopusillus sp.]